MNFDEFEDRIGGISIYQMAIIALNGFVLVGSGGMSQSAIYFSATPKHRCAITDEDVLMNKTEQNIADIFIPPGDSCHKYAYNLSECTFDGRLQCPKNQTNVALIECSNGYVYDKTYFKSTTVTEWDLVCGKTSLDALANSMYFFGIFLGCFISGMMLDWFGRKRTHLIIVIYLAAVGLACSFAPSYSVYVVLRVAIAFSCVPIYIAYFTYAAEISGKKYRLRVGVYVQTVSAMSHSALPGIAYFLNDWRLLCRTLSLIPLSYCLMYYFLPESPRWLLAKGKDDEAKKIMKKFIRSRNIEFPEEDWKQMVINEKKFRSDKNTKIFVSDLFRKPRIRMLSIVNIYMWFTVSMVFYGLVLNVGKLFGNPYFNRVVNALVEIFGSPLYLGSAYYFGRKNSLSLYFTLSGVCCISTMLFMEFANGDAVMLEMSRWIGILGKLFATIVFALVYQHTAEAFPTIARGTAMSTGSMAARIGSIIMPWTLELQYTYTWLTQTIFGILSLIAGATALLVPETKGTDMTTTLQEAENFYVENMHLANKLFFRKSKATKVGMPYENSSNGNQESEIRLDLISK